MWIWQRPDWPAFRWQSETLGPRLRAVTLLQGRLTGESMLSPDASLDTLLQSIITSSAIEGESLNVQSVRSSLARRLNIAGVTGRTTPASEGLANLMIDVTGNGGPLGLDRLLQWHRWLFAGHAPVIDDGVTIGALRGDEPMQVISGPMNNPLVHFEAPPRTDLEAQLEQFILWFNESGEQDMDPLLRAGLAHLWFVTLHPFDDGNGRLARAVGDLALAQTDPQTVRLYAISAAILDDRSGYYAILERTQREDLDITAWQCWFLDTLGHALETAHGRISNALDKARFWQLHGDKGLSREQGIVINRVFERGDFTDGFGARHYKSIAGVSKATATRHLADLVAKGCIEALPGGGRSTRYRICSGRTQAVDNK